MVPERLATRFTGVALILAVLLLNLQFARLISEFVGLYNSTNSSLALEPAICT